MKRLLLILFSLSLLAGSVQSCKKKECPGPTKKEILADGIWRFDKVELYQNGNLNQTNNNLTAKIEFTLGGNYYYYDSSGDLADYGTYTFTEGDPDQLTITSEGGGQPVTFQVEELTQTNMKWHYGDNSNYMLFYLVR